MIMFTFGKTSHIVYIWNSDAGKKQSLVTHVVDFLGGSDVNDLYDELGAVTRCTRVDWDQLKNTVEDLESKCRTSWEQLRSLNQQENFRNILILLIHKPTCYRFYNLKPISYRL